jgi:hypothetical protein
LRGLKQGIAIETTFREDGLMKQLFIAALVVGLLTAVSVPSLAQSQIPPGQDPDLCDVSFNVDVLKLKGILITKIVNKRFDYNLNLESTQAFLPLQLAEVEVFKCDHNEMNIVIVEEFAGSDNINGSFTNFAGIAQINQASGLLNNQGNIAAAGFTNQNDDNTVWSVSMVEVAVEKANIDNILLVNQINGSDNINNSFNGFAGVGQINQASGVLNNQNNVVAIANNLQTIGIMAENDTFLTMQNTGNIAVVSSISGSANINDSFQNGTGAVQINQAPGALNNQANIISIAAAGP